MKKLAVVVLMLLVPAIVSAAEVDLRVRLGGAAPADKLTVDFVGSSNGSGDPSGSFQIEADIAPYEGQVGPIFSVGIFGVNHNGNVPDVFSGLPTDVEYDASGLSLGAGVRVPVSTGFDLEAKFQFNFGSGEPTLSTAGFGTWVVRDGSYTSASLIFGGYYTFENRLQLGLELGAQSFTGNFQFLDNSGFWDDAKIEGSGGFLDFVLGYRF